MTGQSQPGVYLASGPEEKAELVEALLRPLGLAPLPSQFWRWWRQLGILKLAFPMPVAVGIPGPQEKGLLGSTSPEVASQWESTPQEASGSEGHMKQPTGLHTELSLPACLLTPGEPPHKRPCTSPGPASLDWSCLGLLGFTSQSPQSPSHRMLAFERRVSANFPHSFAFNRRTGCGFVCPLSSHATSSLCSGRGCHQSLKRAATDLLSFQAGALHFLEDGTDLAQASPPSRAAWPQPASAGMANHPACSSPVVQILPGSRQKRSHSGPQGFLHQGRASRAVAAEAAAGWGPQQSPSGVLPESLADPAEGEGAGTCLLPPPISAAA